MILPCAYPERTFGMRLLFFDMEFADGRVPGSVFSFGYVMTDENFKILTPPTDICINPESSWNGYVLHHILAYPKKVIDDSPNFPKVYPQIRKLFEKADLAVGFAVKNDITALKKDCERYSLPQIPYRWMDTEQLCRMLGEYPEAHGLSGYVQAWCKKIPEHQHRSDGDALATMLLLEAICKSKHVTPAMLTEAFPACTGYTIPPQKKRGWFSRLCSLFRIRKPESKKKTALPEKRI